MVYQKVTIISKNQSIKILFKLIRFCSNPSCYLQGIISILSLFLTLCFQNSGAVLGNFSSRIMVDITSNESLILIEPSSYYGRLRVVRFVNPFKVPKLIEIAYDICQEFFPSPADKLYNVRSRRGCVLFQ